MKAFRIFIRNVKNGLKSITRNFSLSAASVICTTITLTILAIAMIFSASINNLTKELEDMDRYIVPASLQDDQGIMGAVRLAQLAYEE